MRSEMTRLQNGCFGYGKTGARTESGRCSECGCGGFSGHGDDWSAEGVRGARCWQCGTIKPEAQEQGPWNRSSPCESK